MTDTHIQWKTEISSGEILGRKFCPLHKIDMLKKFYFGCW